MAVVKPLKLIQLKMSCIKLIGTLLTPLSS